MSRVAVQSPSSATAGSVFAAPRLVLRLRSSAGTGARPVPSAHGERAREWEAGPRVHVPGGTRPEDALGLLLDTGNLSFSWRLLLAPESVLDYVVVHELLHLREPNHSKAISRLVEAAQPGWQEQARWLREHGQELHDYQVASVLRGA